MYKQSDLFLDYFNGALPKHGPGTFNSIGGYSCCVIKLEDMFFSLLLCWIYIGEL